MSTTHSTSPAPTTATTPRPTRPIRPITEAEFPAYYRVIHAAFSSGSDPEEGERRRRPLFELDRCLAAFDGADIVGTAATHSFTMTLPGGPRSVAGVAAVAVEPLHRRQGVLSALMDRTLADVRRRGEAVAALFASESSIYGRFGFGQATRRVKYTIHRPEAGLRRDVPRDPALRLRSVEPVKARTELGAVRGQAVARRVGELVRRDTWWDERLADQPNRRHGASPLRCVLVEDDSGPRGYVLYRVRPAWTEHELPDYALLVEELNAVDPAAHVALWEHLAAFDLVGSIHVADRPLDDPIHGLLADPRRARTFVYDGLWVRLVDVGAALAQRAYAAPVDVVIEVTDPRCPWNTGRWHLTGDRGGAACERTEREAEVRLDAATLGAAFLGGPRLGSLAAAGRATECREGAVAELSAALAGSAEPYCGIDF